jgi:hypothetical protein
MAGIEVLLEGEGFSIDKPHFLDTIPKYKQYYEKQVTLNGGHI